jgi:hypothetical protein
MESQYNLTPEDECHARPRIHKEGKFVYEHCGGQSLYEAPICLRDSGVQDSPSNPEPGSKKWHSGVTLSRRAFLLSIQLIRDELALQAQVTD